MGWLSNLKNKLFNFKAVGVAANPKLFSTPAVDDVDSHIARIANRHISNAVLLAKVNAPVVTGELRAGIKKFGPIIRGSNITIGLQNAVIYARRQEYEHPTKAFYMLRALEQIEPELQAELNTAKGLEDIILRVNSEALFTNEDLEGADVGG